VSAVEQPEGHGFDSRCGLGGFSLTKSFRPVLSADNIATVLCHCLEIVRSPASRSPEGLSRPVMG
jgi:hypothetical protein